jgi:hypothetical protein
MVEFDQQKTSFWSTLPGILTGVATLITAVAAVLAIFVSNQGSPSATPTPPPAPESSTSVPSSPAALVPTSPPTRSDPQVPDDWPAYPGPAAVGETGPAARGWQEILIKCGAISDIPENRDGVYGTATGQKVQQLESHWGWLDADTTADRLTYNHIVNAGCS